MSEADADLSVLLVTINWSSETVTFTRSDGMTATMDLPGAAMPNSAILETHWSRYLGGLIATTKAGESVGFEMPEFDGRDQLDGRLIVYLDQNQWSLIARAIHQPQRVRNPDDAAAALRLLDLVKDKKIVLPLSAGHHTETTKWADRDGRYELALTTLTHSRGWQMRDPLAVRRYEIFTSLAQRFKGETAVPKMAIFTLQPNVTSSRPNKSVAGASEQDHTTAALTAATAIIESMLDAEAIAPAPQPGWVGAQQSFSDWLDTETTRSKQVKRTNVDVLLLHDIGDEIAAEAARAQISPEQMHEWMQHYASEIPRCRSLGVYREVLQDRHLNKGTRWRTNDLTDMIYLSCAAAYADFVVAERHIGTILNQGLRRLGRQQVVSTSLRAAVPLIEQLLAAGR